MKVKLYSILLMLSFLVFLCHEIIPHHHHEEIAEYSLPTSNKVEKHSHNGKYHFHHSNNNEQHKDESNLKDRKKHSFPIHYHLLASNDYDFVRLNTKNSNPFQPGLIQLFLTEKISFRLPDNSKNQFLKLPDHPPRIKSFFEPGTIGLRAPPCLS